MKEKLVLLRKLKNMLKFHFIIDFLDYSSKNKNYQNISKNLSFLMSFWPNGSMDYSKLFQDYEEKIGTLCVKKLMKNPNEVPNDKTFEKVLTCRTNLLSVHNLILPMVMKKSDDAPEEKGETNEEE